MYGFANHGKQGIVTDSKNELMETPDPKALSIEALRKEKIRLLNQLEECLLRGDTATSWKMQILKIDIQILQAETSNK